MNTLRSLALASTILAGACAHTKPQLENPMAQAETVAPIVDEGNKLQILAVRDRIEAKCGYFNSAPAMMSAPGSNTVDNVDAAAFFGVTRDKLECFVDAAMSSENGPKLCIPTPRNDRGDSADIVVECKDKADWTQ